MGSGPRIPDRFGTVQRRPTRPHGKSPSSAAPFAQRFIRGRKPRGGSIKVKNLFRLNLLLYVIILTYGWVRWAGNDPTCRQARSTQGGRHAIDPARICGGERRHGELSGGNPWPRRHTSTELSALWSRGARARRTDPRVRADCGGRCRRAD